MTLRSSAGSSRSRRVVTSVGSSSMFLRAASPVSVTRSLALDTTSATAWLARLPAPSAASNGVRSCSVALLTALRTSSVRLVVRLVCAMMITPWGDFPAVSGGVFASEGLVHVQQHLLLPLRELGGRADRVGHRPAGGQVEDSRLHVQGFSGNPQ